MSAADMQGWPERGRDLSSGTAGWEGLLEHFLVSASLQVDCSMVAVNWIKLKIAGVPKITTRPLPFFSSVIKMR